MSVPTIVISLAFFPRTGKSDVADLICRKRFTDDSPIPFGKGTDNDSAPAKIAAGAEHIVLP